jgi:AcrR family transcriptional regulator
LPRTPDPALEARIVAAALRLLDRGGEPAITMRAVATEARTTTPTLYDRFGDRDILMGAVVDQATEDVLAVIRPLRSVEAMFREYLRFGCAHPMRFNLTVEMFGARLQAGEKMPAFDLLKARIAEGIGVRGNRGEDLAFAIASLAFGTVRGMIAAGNDTRHANELRRASLGALRLLLAAFKPKASQNKRRKATRRDRRLGD